MSDTGEKSNLRIKMKEGIMQKVRKCASVFKSVWKNENHHFNGD